MTLNLGVRAHPEWRLLAEVLSTAEYGRCFSHAELAEIAHLPAQSGRYYAQVRRAGRELRREWQRVLEPVAGQGYRVIEPSEFRGTGRRRVVFGSRQFRMAREIFAAAPAALLSDAENAKLADAHARVGALETHARSVLQQTRASLPTPKVNVPKMLTP